MTGSSPTPGGRLIPRLLARQDNAAMLRVLAAAPIEAPALSICFDRQPDIFAMADLKYAPARYVGFFDQNQLVGFIMLGFHRAYVGARPTTVMHVSDYYVLPAYRRRGSFREGVSLLLRERVDGAELGYAVIMQGNRAAERFLAMDAASLPVAGRTRAIATLEAHSLLVTFARRRRAGPTVRRARLDDVDAIVALLQAEYAPRLFAPVIDRDTFVRNLARRPGGGIDSYLVAEEGRQLVGVLAAWDTAAFKQNRVVRYGAGLALTRVAYHAVRPLFGFPALPAPGGAFRDVHITDCAARDRSPAIVAALLEQVYADCRARAYNTIIIGSVADDPMLAAVRGFRREVTRSHVLLFSLTPALLAADRLDTSLPYIDVALL